MTKIAILGTGFSGFGAAYRLAQEPVETVLYDRNTYFGGHTITRKSGGFLFDIGPHVSFTRDARIQQILGDALRGEFETHDYKFSNYWQGHWLRHPAQTNLHGLPPDVIVKVIGDFVAELGREREVRNYEDWLCASYGATFAEWFPGRYTFKYHTTEARNLTTDWMGPRMYRPSLEEMLRGALTAHTPNVHYIQNFRYPKQGGFESYLAGMAPSHRLELGHEVVRIDAKARRLAFRNGREAGYDGLVSSIPLPEVVKLIAGVPQDVLDAAGRLACSACVLVNLGLDRDDFASTHISYFYDLDLVFPRVSFPHMMSGGNAPAGKGSLQVEIYFSDKYRPFHGKPEDYIEPAIRDLVRCGVIAAGDRILARDAVYIPYANIIFDHERTASLATVHGFLDDVGIAHCGRYGDWGYYWTDDSFKSGEAAADWSLGSLGGPRRKTA